MEKLTESQEKVLNAIKLLIYDREYSPTVREIGKKVGLRSPASVQNHIENLKRKGYIEKEDGKSRTIKVIK